MWVVNIANLLTLSRIPILFGVVGLLYLPLRGMSTAAFVLFMMGALSDWADGYMARKRGLVSDFGKLMDALVDKIFMVGLFIGLLALEILPKWALPLLLLIVTREFLVTGLRLVAASASIVLSAEKSGKHKTVSQILATMFLLLSRGLQVDFPCLVPVVVVDSLQVCGFIFFGVASVLTVSSGARYLIKYRLILKGSRSGES